MNSRERTLAMTLLSIILGGGGLFFANLFFFKPIRNLNTQIATKQTEIASRTDAINKEAAVLVEIEKLSPRVAQWQKTSLPDADRDPNSFAAHLSRMKIEYQQHLSKMLNDNGFKARQVKAVEGAGDNKAAANARVKPTYQALGFSVQGDADVPTMMKVFHAFYSAPLLHQIKTFSITSNRTSTNLDVKMTVEVLLVTGAEKRVALLPTFDSEKQEKKPVLMARDLKSLGEAGEHPLFHPPREIVRTEQVNPGPRQPDGEDVQLVLEYVHLSAIYYSDYHGAWLARMSNADDREHGGVWLTDKPLPPGTKFQEAKKRFEDDKKKNEVPKNQTFNEPLRNWVLKDRKNVTVIDLTVVRIEPLRIIINSKDRFYSVPIGKNLWDSCAPALALKNEELAKLGLAGDKDEVLKRVKLDKVDLNEKRKALEATFVNPGAKDAKVVLATEPAPEEFEAPDRWIVRDNLNSEVTRFIVRKIDKDTKVVYFTVKEDLFSIAPGGTLFDAMAKPPMTEEEAKKVGLVKPK